MAAIEFTHLGKTFGKTEVIRDVNLKIEDGEFVVFVGPSGCGKSTILRMLAGLEEITSGEIAIDARVVNDLDPKARNIAMVFQNYAIYPHMSVRQNIAIGLYTSKQSAEEKQKRVEETAQLLGLTPYLDRRPAALSGGQRQRVAIGRAIVRDPSVFLFDEPLSNLDAQLRTQMRIEIKRLHQRLGTTIIYVTHDQVEAMTMADRIVVMKAGQILQVGEPMTLYEHPADVFTARFIGSPSMNIVRGKAVEERYQFDKAGDVLLGFRPQDCKITTAEEMPSSAIFSIQGIVRAIEPLGSETFVHLDVEGEFIVVSAKNEQTMKEGELCRAVLPAGKLYLFDVQTESALGRK